MQITSRHGEAAVAWLFVLLGGWIAFEASRMPAGMAGQPGPGLVPGVIAVVLLVAGAGLAVRAHRLPVVDAGPLVIGSPRIWLTVAMLIGCALVLEPLGFLPTAAIFLAVLLRAFGAAGTLACGFAGAAGAIAAWAFFHLLLGVQLPRGVMTPPW